MACDNRGVAVGEADGDADGVEVADGDAVGVGVGVPGGGVGVVGVGVGVAGVGVGVAGVAVGVGLGPSQLPRTLNTMFISGNPIAAVSVGVAMPQSAALR